MKADEDTFNPRSRVRSGSDVRYNRYNSGPPARFRSNSESRYNPPLNGAEIHRSHTEVQRYRHPNARNRSNTYSGYEAQRSGGFKEAVPTFREPPQIARGDHHHLEGSSYQADQPTTQSSAGNRKECVVCVKKQDPHFSAPPPRFRSRALSEVHRDQYQPGNIKQMDQRPRQRNRSYSVNYGIPEKLASRFTTPDDSGSAFEHSHNHEFLSKLHGFPPFKQEGSSMAKAPFLPTTQQNSSEEEYQSGSRRNSPPPLCNNPVGACPDRWSNIEPPPPPSRSMSGRFRSNAFFIPPQASSSPFDPQSASNSITEIIERSVVGYIRANSSILPHGAGRWSKVSEEMPFPISADEVRKIWFTHTTAEDWFNLERGLNFEERREGDFTARGQGAGSSRGRRGRGWSRGRGRSRGRSDNWELSNRRYNYKKSTYSREGCFRVQKPERSDTNRKIAEEWEKSFEMIEKVLKDEDGDVVMVDAGEDVL